MKSFMSVFCTLAIFCTVSCGTTQPVSDSDSNADRFASLLRDVPGLSVVGRGEYATVRVRGMNDYQGDGQPLFVANGREIIGGFDNLVNSVNAEDVTSVRVLKHSSETIRYGRLGVNGVVELSLEF